MHTTTGFDRAAYDAFLAAKAVTVPDAGFDLPPEAVNPVLFRHQPDIVRWAVKKGRAAVFASFGLGKTVMQLEIERGILGQVGPQGRGLIVMPLGVRQEFARDAAMLGIPVRFIRRSEEVEGGGIYLTNYESVREGKVDPDLFDIVSLDEAAVLRGFGGTKTFRELMRMFGNTTYRIVATATPSPNEYIELLAYAAFLGVMEVGEAKTRFFKRDSSNADKLTLHPHKEAEFWQWVGSWAVFCTRPSDLGHDDTGYDLPPVDIRWHEVPSDHTQAGEERDGQIKMFRDAAVGVSAAAAEKRNSLPARIATMQAIRAEEPEAHRIIWHDLEAEREAIEAAIPGIASAYGSQDLDARERVIMDFANGAIPELAVKPSIAGTGCNFQRHCARAIFLGIGFKFHEFIQALHRIVRFGQAQPVRIDLIYTEAEREIRRALEAKWARHVELVEIMRGIVRQHGLGLAGLRDGLRRTLAGPRQVAEGERWRLVNDDTVVATAELEPDSVGLMLTSIPFATQYEYTPTFNDFGHTDDNAHFWRQMDFLTPSLLRALMPGRVLAVHVKDRITPGGINGFGFQTLHPFSDEAVAHYTRHGFAYLARITITTDVVRENNQTYRLGWTEQCKDGSRMGVGVPEYLLLFRKPPTDRSTGYADTPVVKDKPLCADHGEPAPFDPKTNWRQPVPGTGYSRARWQLDAHGFHRSSGNRLLTPEELRSLPHEQLYKRWREYCRSGLYSHEDHVRVCEQMDAMERLPSTFMQFPPHSIHDEVWTDIARMRTLNAEQVMKGKEVHLCLARGSLVLTRDGFKPIETVRRGDMVLTHLGRWRPVLVARSTGIQPVVELSAHGVPGLRLTPDHKLWVRQIGASAWHQAHMRQSAKRASPAWVRADESVRHYVNQKLPPEEKCGLDDRECWLLGRWLADGHRGTRGDIVVSVGPHKLAHFEAMVGDMAGTRHHGTATQIRIKGASRRLRRLIDGCGRLAAAKQVPAEALAWPAEKARALLDGYLSGDGHWLEDRRRWMATSVSRALLLGLSLIVQRAYGAIASVYAGREGGEVEIEGRNVRTQQEWVMSFDMPDPGRKTGLPFIEGDGAWKKVRSADYGGVTETWCLRVEEDESFTAEGCIVKNCPLQEDICDRTITRFSMPDELVYDPFAGIGSVPVRAVLLGRRGAGAELSPRYWADAVGYLRAAEAKADTPTLFDLAGIELDPANDAGRDEVAA